MMSNVSVWILQDGLCDSLWEQGRQPKRNRKVAGFSTLNRVRILKDLTCKNFGAVWLHRRKTSVLTNIKKNICCGTRYMQRMHLLALIKGGTSVGCTCPSYPTPASFLPSASATYHGCERVTDEQFCLSSSSSAAAVAVEVVVVRATEASVPAVQGQFAGTVLTRICAPGQPPGAGFQQQYPDLPRPGQPKAGKSNGARLGTLYRVFVQPSQVVRGDAWVLLHRMPLPRFTSRGLRGLTGRLR